MTGELTLSGRILPIGGVKEKVLAAQRAGVRTVLLPERNRPHLEDISAHVRRDVEIVFVANMQQVIEHTLLPVPEQRARHELAGAYSSGAGSQA